VEPLVVDEWTPETDPAVVAARAAGRPVTCLAERVLASSPVPVVGITGTAGKTTTAHLLAAMLDAAGHPYAMGRTARAANAWPDDALLAALPSLRPPAVVVAELTSTHLCYMATAPAIAVVTCLWPDHAEYHGSEAAYLRAKRRILDRQRSGDVAVLNGADPGSAALGDVGPARRAWFEGVGPATSLAAAAATARVLGLPEAAIAVVTARGIALPHRFRERVWTGAIRAVDDGMAATPGKVLAALARLGGARVVWIGGGDDDGLVHTSPAEAAALAAACAAVRDAGWRPVLFGPAAARLAPGVGGAVVGTLADAIARARALARPGDVVLFAPMFPVGMAERELFAGAG
jgi:UDP-N-acetylmuramoylalanine--D-glutamate ligase